MCKCCQTCLESCYWHCFEKWFCYDENIALYEDPLADEKPQRSYDNIAFWDSVAVIANRSVVTIQPLPNKNNNKTIIQEPIISTKLTPDVEKQDQQLKTDTTDSTKSAEKELKVTIQEPTPEKDSVKLRKQSTIEEIIEYRQRGESNAQEKRRKQSTIEEKIEQRQRTESNAQDKHRKKSLKERRKSAAGLTLKLDNDFHEIPVIRQSSVPKFFLDTPDVDSFYGNYPGERSSVLVSPSIGNSPTFDLKSIVQIENEIMAQQSKPSTPKTNRASKLSQVKKKFKPIIKKPSSKSLPDTINHI